MIRRSFVLPSVLAALTLASVAKAQQYVFTTDSSTDRVVALSPVDGSLISANAFSIPATVQVSAIDVNGQIWVSEQTGDRVVRYDSVGNVLGVMGPTLPGGGFDNIRGMAFINGIVYVTNDGAGNGATADSLVTFDAAGNYLSTIALTASPSPFSVIPFQGDMLVVSSSALDDIHRYTLVGASVGTFHDSASIGFGHQGILASDGNVWVTTFTSDTILKLDATNGANILQTIAVDNARGVFELQNGNLLWTNTDGVWLYNVGTSTSTLVHSGACYHLNLALSQHAHHLKYGDGCHSYFSDDSDLFQLFADVPAAKLALDGNAMQFNRTANGYVANWLPGVAGAMYLAPSVGAAIIANADNTTTAITPLAAIPVPGGTEATWTVSSNGILTAGNPGNHTTTSAATLASIDTVTRLAFYTWCNHNPAEAGSGKVKWEEVGGVLYVTYEGVEFNGGTPTVAPSTFQWQINMATGDVTMLWVSFSSSNSTADVIVGCTLANVGIVPVSQTLSTVVARVMQPDRTQVPLTLTAGPAPIINPSTPVTYTIGDIPEVSPGAGLYLSAIFLSLNPLLPGIDLTGILTTVPGCRLYISSLDASIGTAITVAPTNQAAFTFSAPPFSPGIMLGAQAVALFDGSFPLLNGESGGFTVSNGVMTITRVQ